MLWQWGEKDYADTFVRELQLATTEGDGEDRVNATLELADYFNLLRDYKRAAGAHRAAQALARGADVELLPIAWYSAACVHALLGDTERGMKALQRCAEMHASPHLDRSRRLERKLFENDPEIAALRSDKRFPALLSWRSATPPTSPKRAAAEPGLIRCRCPFPSSLGSSWSSATASWAAYCLVKESSTT